MKKAPLLHLGPPRLRAGKLFPALSPRVGIVGEEFPPDLLQSPISDWTGGERSVFTSL
jgi:hypothetical protein